MTGNFMDNNVVLFFFAHEKLLFRFPVENPFVIDVAAASSASIPSPLTAASSSSKPNNNASVGGGVSPTTNSQSKRASVASTQPVSSTELANRAEATGDPDGRSNGNSSNSVPVTAVGLTTRHKKKPKKLAIPPPDSTPDAVASQHALSGKSDNNGGAVAVGPPVLSQGSGTKLRRPVSMASLASVSSVSPQGITDTSVVGPTGKLRTSTTFGSGGMECMGSDRATPTPTTTTCVGIPVNSLLHLLRAPFTGFTTINLSNCTLLVLPLTVTRANARVMPESNGSATLVGANGGETQKRARASTAMLVAAMYRPDTDSGTISRFLQCFMNILYREEQRAQYVSKQIKVMEQLQCEWERGRGEVQGGAPSTTSSKENISLDLRVINGDMMEEMKASTGGRESVMTTFGSAGTTDQMRQPTFLGPTNGSVDRFTYLAEHPKTTLCTTIAQLAHSINVWCATMRATECRLSCYATSAAAHPFFHSYPGNGLGANQHVASAPSPPPPLSGTILIKDILHLPLSFLTGVAPRPQNISSISFSRNPLSLFRLNPACNLSLNELESEYIEALGRSNARLFTLSSVQACLTRLATPWRIGALNRSLECALIKMNKLRRGILSRQFQQQRSDGATGQPLASDAPGVPHPYGNSERDTRATALSVLPQSLNLDFLVADIVEFLQLQGVILVDREVTVSFTHGDVVPAYVMSKQQSKISRRQLKLSGSLHTSSAPRLTLLQRSDTSTANPRASCGKLGRYTMMPSILLLNMLMLLFAHSRERSRKYVGDPSGALFDASSTGVSSKKISGTFVASPHLFLGTNMSTSITSNTLLGSSPLTATAKCPQHMVVSKQILPAAAVPGEHEQVELVSYCAWGSACTLCEALASNPQCWLLHIETDYNCCGGRCPIHCQPSGAFEVPARLHFPFLDSSVRVCAEHEAKLHRQKASKYTGPLSEINHGHNNFGADGAVRFSSHHRSTALGETHTQMQRPWFLKPEIYMGPVESNIISSFEVFKQLTSLTAEASSDRMNLSLDASPPSNVRNRPDKTVDEEQNDESLHHPGQPSSEKEESSLLLSAESIPVEARAWLSRFASTIVGRVEYAMECQRQLEHQLASGPLAHANGNENSSTGASDAFHRPLHPAVCKTSRGPNKTHTGVQSSLAVALGAESTAKVSIAPSDPTLGGTCGVETGLSKADTAAASSDPPLLESSPASSGVCTTSYSTRYTKRRLPDCNAIRPVPLLEFPLLGSSKLSDSALLSSQQEHVGAVSRQPKGTSERGLCASTAPLGGQNEEVRFRDVSSVLRSANRHVPVKVFLIVVMHHLVAFTWGKSGVDVEMLVRLLERNLRRLLPLLSNLTYVLQLVDAGCSSKSLCSMLKTRGGGFESQATTDNCMQNVRMTKKRGSDQLNETEGGANTMNNTFREDPMSCESISSLSSYSKFTLTLVDYQLLLTLETYDALSLLPTIRTYAGSLVEIIPTRLLLHTVVNEFSDVFFIGGSKGGMYGEQVNARAL